MATLNITYNGRSADLPGEIEEFLTDDDIRALAVEVVRSGGLPGLHIDGLAAEAFSYFVVDRLDHGRRVYLRPKVPFGA